MNTNQCWAVLTRLLIKQKNLVDDNKPCSFSLLIKLRQNEWNAPCGESKQMLHGTEHVAA